MDDRGERLLQALEGILGGWRDDIPVRFYRTFADEPFMTCDYCRRPLLEPGTRYVISKVYAGGELLQELAQCYGCRQELKSGDSQASTTAIAQLFAQATKSQRFAVAADPTLDRPAMLMRNCLLCGVSNEHVSTYVEYAYCEGREIVYYVHPSMVCEDCLVHLHDALSEETKDHRRRWQQKHYGFPPCWGTMRPVEHLCDILVV